ncbi:UrcA family protein [Erythrobacter sp. JK5]|uniref:UrcA family protein n=1 Tax=Erythrobacter sp. JK5 TaxID=2829500 RepID=UPI001BA8B8CF|nr:UrcA family protein [Erythrobacter sp. JK5]QUL38753.1 UrcA family protein [Erythrobacter sp. JK5]
MRFIAATFATSLALIAAPAAASGMNATEFTAEVQHKDVDLTSRDGVALLDERLKTTIRQQCANGGRDLQSIRLERECRQSALASVERQVRFAVAEAKANKVRLAQGTPVAPQG